MKPIEDAPLYVDLARLAGLDDTAPFTTQVLEAPEHADTAPAPSPVDGASIRLDALRDTAARDDDPDPPPPPA